MKINVKWFDGKYPSFNLELSSKEGAEPFVTIRGCKIIQGGKGEFVSPPSTKNQQTNKYWNHAMFSEEFSNHVLSIAKASMPVPQNNRNDAFNDSDIPF